MLRPGLIRYSLRMSNTIKFSKVKWRVPIGNCQLNRSHNHLKCGSTLTQNSQRWRVCLSVSASAQALSIYLLLNQLGNKGGDSNPWFWGQYPRPASLDVIIETNFLQWDLIFCICTLAPSFTSTNWFWARQQLKGSLCCVSIFDCKTKSLIYFICLPFWFCYYFTIVWGENRVEKSYQ